MVLPVLFEFECGLASSSGHINMRQFIAPVADSLIMWSLGREAGELILLSLRSDVG